MEAQLFITGMILAAWLLLTVALNVPPASARVFSIISPGRWICLVPSWAFFAPNPANRDYALLYRDRFDSGDLSPWREVPHLSGQQRSISTALWNPHNRPKKALSDAAAHLVAIVRDSAVDRVDMSIVLSVPYLLLLNRITHIPRGSGVTGRQFLVVQHSITQVDPEVMIVSNMHDV